MKKSMTRTEALARGLCGDCHKKHRWMNPQGKRITRCFDCKERVYGKKSNRAKGERPMRRRMRGRGSDGSRQEVLAYLRGLADVKEVGCFGWPDIWYIKHDGTAHFVEVKSGKDTLRAQQERCHAALRMANVNVEILDPQTVRMFAKAAKARREPFEMKVPAQSVPAEPKRKAASA